MTSNMEFVSWNIGQHRATNEGFYDLNISKFNLFNPPVYLDLFSLVHLADVR